MCMYFFSSRRRHTRFDCDWSSDVCSSDLALLVGVGCITAVQRGIAQGRVAGRVTLLEKSGKSSPDLAAAVVYLEGGTADDVARPVTVDIAINDKEFVPRVVVVPLGSTVRFPNHDPFDHNVF